MFVLPTGLWLYFAAWAGLAGYEIATYNQECPQCVPDEPGEEPTDPPAEVDESVTPWFNVKRWENSEVVCYVTYAPNGRDGGGATCRWK